MGSTLGTAYVVALPLARKEGFILSEVLDLQYYLHPLVLPPS